MSHRVEKNRRHFTRRELFNRAERKFDVAVAVGRKAVVVDGIIPPDADFAPENFVDLGKFGVGYSVADDSAPAVKHDDFRVEIFGKVAGVRLELVALNHVVIKIFRRHHYQRRNVLVARTKIFLHAVEEFGLKLAVLVMTPFVVLEVVEKNREVAHADIVHGVELANQRVKVRVACRAFVVEVETGAHGENKAHIILLGDGNQIPQFVEFVGGIGLAPLVAVIRVVLGRVNV